MKRIEVFDKPMCCSTGVCGPQVDPVLPRFAADLEWLKSQGHHVERFNLAQQPQEFINHSQVQELLAKHGTDCLPVILVDDHVVSRSGYPSREMLSLWAGSAMSLPIATDTQGSSGRVDCDSGKPGCC